MRTHLGRRRLRRSGCLERTARTSARLRSDRWRPRTARAPSRARARASTYVAPQRPRERAAEVVLLGESRCRGAARPDEIVPAFRFAVPASARKYSACRRRTSSASGDCVEPLERVLADRVEHAEAPGSPARRTRLFSTSDSSCVEIAVADGLRRLEREASAEHAESTEQLLLLAVEQLVAPLDRRAQRSLPRRRVAGARSEERQPLVEAREQVVRIEQRDARGRELDRERQPVEPLGRSRPTSGVGRKPGATARARSTKSTAASSSGKRLDRVPLLRRRGAAARGS